MTPQSPGRGADRQPRAGRGERPADEEARCTPDSGGVAAPRAPEAEASLQAPKEERGRQQPELAKSSLPCDG